MLSVWADTSAASLVLAGLLGTAVAVTTGPYLAMGLAIYSGHTEPVLPSLAFPWATLVGVILAGVAARVAAGRWEDPAARRLARAGQGLASLLVALLPVVHLGRLYALT